MITLTEPNTFVVPDMPDEELQAAIQSGIQKEDWVMRITESIPQAELLSTLNKLSFSAPHYFYRFFSTLPKRVTCA
jgi:hypothetical protein